MKIPENIGLVLLTFLLGIAIGFAVAKMGFTKVSITGPDGVGIELDRNIDHLQVLEEMLADPLMGKGMIGWLAEKSVYEISDPSLAIALNQDLCDPIPDSPMEALMEKGDECASKPVAKALRDLARAKEPPFHYLGSPVRVSKQVEEPHRPSVGYANTCREGLFFRQDIQIRNPLDDGRIVQVKAQGSYPCPPSPRSDIQLNEIDMSKLFDGAVMETEAAYAFVLE